MNWLYKNFGKRFLDLTISLFILIALLPLIVIITLILYYVNQGKPFFFQERPGLQERTIRVVKFKSMNDRRDDDGNLLPDNIRLTPVGAFIRKTSLDELPQLYNVLIGEMSLVGPRPLLFKYLPLYSTEQRLRHSVKPGITGLAQVNGRNSISWSEKFRHDINYVKSLSFALDIKIMFMTVLKVIRREGINQSEARPMQPFNGKN